MSHSPSPPQPCQPLDEEQPAPGVGGTREPAPSATPPQPHSPTRQALKDALVALSLANLYFIQSWFSLLFEEDFGYFNQVPVTRAALLALFLNVLWVALIAWLGARFLRRTRSRFLRTAGDLAFCASLVIPLNFIRLNLLSIPGVHLMAFAKTPAGILIAIIMLGFALRWHRGLARAAKAGVFIFFPLIFFSLGHASWIWLFPRTYPPPANHAKPVVARPTSVPAPRVVWIIFDELDQRVAFSERPASVQMPAFDRFGGNCLQALNAYPPAGCTSISLPALTTGKSVSRTQPQNHSELAITLADTGKTVGWSTLPNVFSRAKELGLKTGAVGWFHPYSRLFGGDLDFCFWMPYAPFEQARDYSLPASMIHQIWATMSPLQQRRLHIRLYQSMQTNSVSLVANADNNLALLHLAVPHRPGIYAPNTRRLTIWGSFSRRREYLNNLLLMDRSFGELRQAMEAAGTWDSSWLVVSADHWWRESASYDGKEEHRIPFFVKAPGTNVPHTYTPRMNTLVTYDLILAILRGELTHAGQLVSWLDRHRIEPPKSYGNSAEAN